MGYFSIKNGLNISFAETKILRRKNLNQLKLKIMSVITQEEIQEPIEIYLSTPDNPHLDSMSRFNFVVLSHVKDFFNFT